MMETLRGERIMLAKAYRLYAMVFVISLICCPGISYGQDKEVSADVPTGSVSASGTEESEKEEASEGKGDMFFSASGMMEQLGAELREERIAALKEIDRERKETLDYLSREREKTISDLEGVGNRLISNAITKSETLIDHLMIRILQVAAVVILGICIIGFISARILIQNKNQP